MSITPFTTSIIKMHWIETIRPGYIILAPILHDYFDRFFIFLKQQNGENDLALGDITSLLVLNVENETPCEEGEIQISLTCFLLPHKRIVKIYVYAYIEDAINGHLSGKAYKGVKTIALKFIDDKVLTINVIHNERGYI